MSGVTVLTILSVFQPAGYRLTDGSRYDLRESLAEMARRGADMCAVARLSPSQIACAIVAIRQVRGATPQERLESAIDLLRYMQTETAQVHHSGDSAHPNP